MSDLFEDDDDKDLIAEDEFVDEKDILGEQSNYATYDARRKKNALRMKLKIFLIMNDVCHLMHGGIKEVLNHAIES